MGTLEKRWVFDWLMHPESQKRAENYGITDLQQRASNVRNTALNISPKDWGEIALPGEYDLTKYPLGSYNPDIPMVTMNVTPDSIIKVPGRNKNEFSSTVVHEFGHASDLDQFFQPLAPKYTINPKLQDYFQTGEAWPRIMEIRYNLNKKPGEPVTKEELNKAKEILPNNLIWQAYDDLEILEMLNKWVSNKSLNNYSNIAKYGKLVN